MKILNKDIEKKFQEMENKFSEKFKTEKYKFVAIGYLDSSEEYEKGNVPQKFINKLRILWNQDSILMSMGHHECDFCKGGYGTNKRATSSSEKILTDKKNKIKYIIPEMIFHYIEKHNFLPNGKFIEFIMGEM